MNTITRLALAVALPVAALAFTGQPAFAAPPPTEPPSPDGGVVIPPDFVTLTDDSGTITVDVPSSWIDVDTAPLGGEFPQIEATPYRQAYYDTFDVPGVTYRAIQFTTDTESLVHNFAIPDGCAHEEVQPYDDGVFVGSHLVDSECGSFATAEYHVIVANPANQALTAVVVVQITGAHELPILERVLDSFNVAAGAGPTTSTLPTSSTVAAPTTTTDAAGVFPPPTGEIPAGWTDLIDDTATIRISVPASWADVDVSAGTNDNGTAQPWISASTDLDVFFPPEGTEYTFSVPGVDYAALPFTTDTAAMLASSSSHDVCTAEPVQAYDDGVFAGHIQFFDGCGGTSSRAVEIYANPADGAFTAAVFIQLTGQPDDDATLNGLLLSFNRVSSAESTTTTATSDSDIAYIQQRLREGYGREATEEQVHCLLEDPTFDVDDPDGIRVGLMVNCGVTPVDTPSTSLESSNAVAALDQMLHDQLGVTVTDEQTSCLADNAGQLEPTDITTAAADPYGMPATVMLVLLNCGVDVFNVPGG